MELTKIHKGKFHGAVSGPVDETRYGFAGYVAFRTEDETRAQKLLDSL